MYFNFDPMSEPADMAFLSTHLDSDIDSKIKSTAYFKEFSQYFLEKKKCAQRHLMLYGIKFLT